MKLLFILLTGFSLFATNKTHAQQAGVPDTSVYLHQIAANKAAFIGKPFSELEKTLKIKIKAFFPFRGIHHDIRKETSTVYHFIIPVELQDFERPYLDVYWQTPLNAEESEIIFKKGKGGDWIPEAYEFYKNAIIEDIEARR